MLASSCVAVTAVLIQTLIWCLASRFEVYPRYLIWSTSSFRWTDMVAFKYLRHTGGLSSTYFWRSWSLCEHWVESISIIIMVLVCLLYCWTHHSSAMCCYITVQVSKLLHSSICFQSHSLDCWWWKSSSEKMFNRAMVLEMVKAHWALL